MSTCSWFFWKKPLAVAALSGLAGGFLVSQEASAASSPPILEGQSRLFRPVLPLRPAAPQKSSAKAATTIRYSQSTRAGNMVLPAVLLGMPLIVVLALIIRAMKDD